MNASALSTATVTVAFVNPPKAPRKSGTIKDSDGQYFSAWPDKLAQFRAGETYEIEFTEKKLDSGIVARDIKTARPVATVSTPLQGEHTVNAAVREVVTKPKPAAQPTNGATYYRPTAPRDAERMFVCGTLQACIKTGRIEFTEDALINTINALRDAWAATFGADDLAAG